MWNVPDLSRNTLEDSRIQKYEDDLFNEESVLEVSRLDIR